MTVLVVGLSHRSAPMALLERVAMSPADAGRFARQLIQGAHVSEAAVLATCNRVEVITEVNAFHGGLTEIAAALSEQSGVPLADLTPHLYAHYTKEAVHHLFSVASGLDSMAIGESQVLGQLRVTLRHAQSDLTLGRGLGELLQNALRVGKRVHSATGLGKAGPSLVNAALTRAAVATGRDIQDSTVLVIGAGSMSSLAAVTAHRAGARVLVGNRTAARAERLAGQVQGTGFGLLDSAALRSALQRADVVLSCTGAAGRVLTRADVPEQRPAHQVYADLALPHDVDPDIGLLSGVRMFGLAEIGGWLADEPIGNEIAAARRIVDAEVETWANGQREESATPVIVALRSQADGVVHAELARLRQRLPGLDPVVDAQLEQTVRRVVDKLLHTPTVRVKSLTAAHGGGSYATVMRDLFDLQVPAASVVGVEGAIGTDPTVMVAEGVRVR